MNKLQTINEKLLRKLIRETILRTVLNEDDGSESDEFEKALFVNELDEDIASVAVTVPMVIGFLWVYSKAFPNISGFAKEVTLTLFDALSQKAQSGIKKIAGKYKSEKPELIKAVGKLSDDQKLGSMIKSLADMKDSGDASGVPAAKKKISDYVTSKVTSQGNPDPGPKARAAAEESGKRYRGEID